MNKTTLILAMCVALGASVAYGQVVITHEGANDPLGEGWELIKTADGGPFLTTVGPVEPDPDYPTVDAWQIDTKVSEAFYRYILTGPEQADAAANGWTYTGTWRLVTGYEGDQGVFSNGICSVIARANDPWTWAIRAEMDLGATADDRALKNFTDGGTITDLGDVAYHTVVWVYDPAGTVDFYLDGVRQSQTSIGPLTIEDVRFGSVNADSASTAVRNYSLVQFEYGMHPPTQQGCNPGDADRDGDVDDDDLSLLLANWGGDVDCTKGEFSGTPPVEDDDLSLLLANWTGSQDAAVPEPAMVGLVALGALAMLRRKR